MVIYYPYDNLTWQTLQRGLHFIQNKYSLLWVIIKKKKGLLWFNFKWLIIVYD